MVKKSKTKVLGYATRYPIITYKKKGGVSSGFIKRFVKK
tara:strand:+ start:475 stop:591 length:117 start_codon:yes stop_codon:yes gene_type:complete